MNSVTQEAPKSTPSSAEPTLSHPVHSHQGLYAASLLDCDEEALRLAPGGYLASRLIQQATEDVWDSSLGVSEFRIRVSRPVKGEAVVLTNEFEHDSGRYAHQRISVMEEHLNCASFDIRFLPKSETAFKIDDLAKFAPQAHELPTWKGSDEASFDLRFDYRSVESPGDAAIPSTHWGGWIRNKQSQGVSASMLAFLADASLRTHIGEPSGQFELSMKFYLPHPSSMLSTARFFLTLFEANGPQGSVLDLNGSVWTSYGIRLAEVNYLAY